ncbi:MAG: cyclase family protein [Nocardioides sp.]
MSPAPPPLTEAGDFRALCRKVSNWGRWGADDQRGTLNLVTPERVLEARDAIVDGTVVPLGIPLGGDGPQGTSPNPRRFDPIHLMTQLPHEHIREGAVGASDDVLILPLQAGTQWDALAHMAHEGQLYGGRSVDHVTSDGAEVCSIEEISDRLVTRALLLDVARAEGVEHLPAGFAIDDRVLTRCLEQQGSDLRSGDVLLIRTGWLEHCRKSAWEGFTATESPGLDISVLPLLHDAGAAGVASDTSAVEVKPSPVPGQTLPFHIAALVYMGLLLGEIFDLERLAALAASDGRYDGMLVAPPLPVRRAVGSPVNPYVIR